MSLLDLSFTNLKPPVITLGDGTMEDIVSFVDSLLLSRTEKTVLSGIKKVIDDNGERYCSAEQVGKFLNRSEETVRQALKKLVSRGVFKEEGCRTHAIKVRRSSLFVFNKNTNARTLDNKEVEQGKLELNRTYMELIRERTAVGHYGLADDLICGFLFCALEYNHKRQRDKIEAVIFFDGEPIRVTALSQKGKRVALVKDLRYYLAILKLCEQEMENRIAKSKVGLLEKEFIMSTLFDVHESDVLKAMGWGSGSGERENMRKALERLDGTIYYIESAPLHIMEQLGLEKYKLKVVHFSIKEYLKSKDGRVLYRLELDHTNVAKMYRSLSMNIKIFNRTDPRIMTEVNSLKFAFMLFCVTQNPGSIKSFSWESLKDKVAPSYSMRVFKEELSKLLSKNAQDLEDGSKALIWESNGKVVNECLSEIFDVSVMYTLETGFRIQRKSTDSLLEEKKITKQKRLLN